LLLELLLRWYRDVLGATLEGVEEFWVEMLGQSHGFCDARSGFWGLGCCFEDGSLAALEVD